MQTTTATKKEKVLLTQLVLVAGGLTNYVTAQRLHPTLSSLHISRRALAEEAEETGFADRRTLHDDDDDDDENGEKDQEEDGLVVDLPGLDANVDITHHAGLIPMDDTGRNNLFYWHFVASNAPETAPLVIWLNGGPGCSSMQGLFLGISPFKLVDGSTIGINDHSWHHTANMLFIDQPVGTGMAYSARCDYRVDEQTIAEDFYKFLIKFFQKHNEYLSTINGSNTKVSRKLFIFGESHAGRYIPLFSDYILAQNQNGNKDVDITIDLTGTGIGNGWVHPVIQYDYSDYAHGLGLLTFGQVRSLKSSFEDCKSALEAGNYLASSCFDNMNAIMSSVQNAHNGKSLNYYDVRQYLQRISAYPPGQDDIVKYLNQLSVRKALHANTKDNFRFKTCSNGVWDGLKKFDGESTLDKVQNLLQKGVRMLFYNGQWDMMCNHYGTEKLLLSLDWNGSIEYQEATKYVWTVKGRHQPAGYAQQGGGLTYLVVTESGHMVPMDVPDVAADMIQRFIKNQQFDDSAQSVLTMPTNATNFEAMTQCYTDSEAAVGFSSAMTSATTGLIGGDGALGITWLWIAVVIALVSSVLSVAVTLMCVQTKKPKRAEHEMIIQESDDDDDDEDDSDDECVTSMAVIVTKKDEEESERSRDDGISPV